MGIPACSVCLSMPQYQVFRVFIPFALSVGPPGPKSKGISLLDFACFRALRFRERVRETNAPFAVGWNYIGGLTRIVSS